MVLDEHVLLRKKVSGPLLRPQLIACLFAEYDCPTAREDDVILAKEKAVTLDLVEPRPTAAARHANIAILAGRLNNIINEMKCERKQAMVKTSEFHGQRLSSK